MEVRTGIQIQKTPGEVWRLLTDATVFPRWSGMPVEAAEFREGGYLRLAAVGTIPPATVAITAFEPEKRLAFAGPWIDEMYTLSPVAGGCVLEKCVLGKNGVSFDGEAYQSELARQQGFLTAFKAVAEQPMPAAIPYAYGEVPTGAGGMHAAQPAPKKSGKKWAILAAVLAALAVIGVSVWYFAIRPKLLEKDRRERYSNGVEAIKDGKYEQAKEIFDGLGDYKDSKSKLAYAEKAITYQKAMEQVNRAEFREARKVLVTLDGFENSAELIARCDRGIAYEEAVALRAEGKYQEAYEKFLAAGDYQGAEGQAKRCKEDAVQQEILDLMDAGKYEEALEKLNTSDASNMPDRATYKRECTNAIDYEKAIALFKEEKYYSASTAFSKLGSYKESKNYLAKCVQPKPSTRETYHNSTYSGKAVSLKIQPPTNDGSCTYFKIYKKSGNEEILVLSAFIAQGQNITVTMPAGDYIFKAAYGTGDWYGEKEMFGSKGTYQRLKSSETSDIFSVSSGSYTLTLRASTGSGNVGTKSESRDNF